ncbi:MAG: hypothetical protein HY550_10440, partial [Elusimicrobia bacterium]|nr:hypothetical protein [Elusimicrobiota bacterium]
PAPAPAVPGPAPADAWKKMLGQVASKRPSLYNILLSVKLVFADAGRWRLLTAAEFEAAMIEKARPELEELLQRFAGRKIALEPECAPAAKAEAAPVPREEDLPGQEETIVEEALEAEAAQEAPAPKAAGPKQVYAETEPELKHLAKVFHGRITKINKVK